MSDASTQSIKENEKEREKKELVCLRKISEVWSKLFHYKGRSKFFLVCALNFSLHPPYKVMVSERNWKN
jgi:hypothetical protein